MLRHCLPASIRQTLDQLPKSLDDTYLRVLSQIPQANQAHAHRMLQCLVVAVRPLLVEELAELLAFEFDARQGAIPKYRPALRSDDQSQAVLSTCSSLVTIIVERDGRRVVQFSHFSVKEFLVSNRLASSLRDISRYHIRLGSAHTILTQACLGILLHSDDYITKWSFPFAGYAARNWVEHAQFKDVASHVKDGMETLFDPDKPHFATWTQIHNIDQNVLGRSDWKQPKPLYYSVICGFYGLVEHLAIKHPHHVNDVGGQYRFPLFEALAKGHVEFVEFLLKQGADANAEIDNGRTPLHILSERWIKDEGDALNLVLLLLKHDAEVNRRDKDNQTPLHQAILQDRFKLAEILLEHGADANAENNYGRTPLHILLDNCTKDEGAVLNLVLLLLKHGAEVNRRDKDNQTPLHQAIRRDRFKLAEILLEHGADANAENDSGKTPLHILSQRWFFDEGDVLNLVLLLLTHGAEVNRRDKDNQTPFLLAVRWNQFKLAGMFLEHGADADAANNSGMTPLHILSNSEGQIKDEGSVRNFALLLLKHGTAANRRNKDSETPLHLAIRSDQFKLAETLLEHGTDVHAENKKGRTPLRILSESWNYDEGDFVNHARILLAHGVGSSRQEGDNKTSLLLGIGKGSTSLREFLLSVAQMPP